mmetsp:Transcript_22590/g.57433  ORF Transcript_22590/g.57433 Transcript_22590/m.57433 type:complete len:206 (+) Transcript_22590:136-753(+)
MPLSLSFLDDMLCACLQQSCSACTVRDCSVIEAAHSHTYNCQTQPLASYAQQSPCIAQPSSRLCTHACTARSTTNDPCHAVMPATYNKTKHACQPRFDCTTNTSCHHKQQMPGCRDYCTLKTQQIGMPTYMCSHHTVLMQWLPAHANAAQDAWRTLYRPCSLICSRSCSGLANRAVTCFATAMRIQGGGRKHHRMPATYSRGKSH